MAKRKLTTYEVWVYIAYSFFILLGSLWFLLSFFNSGHFNYQAFIMVLLFSAQAYFHHALTNLIVGILALIFSIYMTLQVVSSLKEFSGIEAKVILGIALFSVAMSIVLLFSYMKLKLKDEE